MRRPLLAVVAVASAMLVALAAASCGLDIVGSAEPRRPLDASTTTDVVFPPSLDAAADASADGGACPPDASLATDPENCGSCAHSCFGSTCASGDCTPQVFATGDGGAVGLAIDDGGVYVAAFNAGSILKLDRATGADAGLLASTQGAPNEVFVHEGQVYWANYVDPGQVMSCPTTGCLTPTPVVAPIGLPVYPWVSGTQLYVTSYQSGNVERCTLPTCLDRAPIGNVGGAHTLFVAADRVWVTGYSGTGSLVSMQLDGGSPVVHRTNAANPRGVWVTASDVWLAIEDENAIVRCPKVGTCENVPSFANGVGPITVAVDDGYVYWANYAKGAVGAGSIMRCPVGGCPAGGPKAIAVGLDGPWALAFDDRFVYWTNYSAASAMVMRLAK